MKQHITEEQARMLSDNQLVKLHNFLCSGDRTRVKHINDDDLGFSGGILRNVELSSFRKISLFTNIGKMIEILNNYDWYNGVNVFVKKDSSHSVVVWDKYKHDESISCYIPKTNYGKELCDALFEAVKEVL